ncbi:immunity 49 family protein [Streptomyces clavuligerus]|uniref:Uncharacterized protein n=1 Tax=Streptomyces clavuligerus TaxID=1901 RepID=B5H218_STRCL|nr:immunity 49 family protein [Streptomyces clavuligerus]ANW20100.1 hypothetical protein BB341_18720 [Streptomyces clavuligerus]AXU14726.1 hypothetical protein D1794_19540 [Streptomyces clavuligerus]EDY52614.1 hypothetical protein SSCG_05642 [Streptomyces clavuligerus]EFG06997.1 Hypothetical protein SCLAV_1924 [Streptomyces clavuligerus]MBY6304751.1 immunity 49 family protein [Streptomyces clavuligerus]
MTATVSRHYSPGPKDEEWAGHLGDRVAKTIGELERFPHMIDSVFNNALLHFGARCGIDPVADRLETWEAAVNALQVGSAMFATTAGTEGTVQCVINRETRTLPLEGPAGFAGLGNWLTTFWLAVACRDKKRMTELCEIPLDRLSRRGYDDYALHWVDTLQTYWLRRPGLVEKLTRTMEMSAPDAVTEAPVDLLQEVLYPPINLFYRFVTNDPEGFNQALEEGLELHKRYWSADEDREDDPAGHVALGLLAVTCFAYDGGIPIEVESGYLPRHLITRDWVGEFPT